MTLFDSVEIGIRQLHARCADAVWRKDAVSFAGCYTEDGEWKVAGRHFRGRAEIASGLQELISPNQRVLMAFGTPILEVGQGSAHGRTYTTELVKRADGQGFRTIGSYYERFVGQGDRWLFKWRHFDMYYYGRPDLSDPFLECPDYGPPPAMP